ncbi:thiamine-phosphate kinase [Prochlorococcus sp. MIT 1341]|uniref:thiamine-phosphate kinase n=1 Tax=Prochlorococcus sp. MIT 1341 TaxID=3096221 RepID=UPI002A75742D|nr:thiamine-phosphate kinase [Prochlorococcus sp. MIT 1341]
MNETLKQLGEDEILNRISHYLPNGQIEDDTAVISAKGKELLINTDVLVEGIHFNELTTNPEDIGWKAIAANISDLSASGVEEFIGLTIGLITPPNTKWEWVSGVYEGIKSALNHYGGEILGGDCSNGKQKLIAITAFGTLGPLHIHRGNAIPGDYIVVSGPHGLSRLGLGLLLNDPQIKELNIQKSLKEEAIKSHRRPHPSIQIIRKLEKCKPNHLAWRAGGTDSSDGLIKALECICKSSKCSAVITRKDLPKPSHWPTGNLWEDWCINGGEDFELVLSLPPTWAKAFIEEVSTSKIIGKIESGPAKVFWRDEDGEISSKTSYKHF